MERVMREHFYRGIDKEAGIWVFGNYIYLEKYREKYGVERNNVHLIMPRAFDKEKMLDSMGIEVIPETVGQFTGLTDENNEKIFMGDIIQYLNTERKKVNAKVGFKNGTYVTQVIGVDIPPHPAFLTCKNKGGVKVIGNCHDNKELLKGLANV